MAKPNGKPTAKSESRKSSARPDEGIIKTKVNDTRALPETPRKKSASSRQIIKTRIDDPRSIDD